MSSNIHKRAVFGWISVGLAAVSLVAFWWFNSVEARIRRLVFQPAQAVDQKTGLRAEKPMSAADTATAMSPSAWPLLVGYLTNPPQPSRFELWLAGKGKSVGLPIFTSTDPSDVVANASGIVQSLGTNALPMLPALANMLLETNYLALIQGVFTTNSPARLITTNNAVKGRLNAYSRMWEAKHELAHCVASVGFEGLPVLFSGAGSADIRVRQVCSRGFDRLGKWQPDFWHRVMESYEQNPDCLHPYRLDHLAMLSSCHADPGRVMRVLQREFSNTNLAIKIQAARVALHFFVRASSRFVPESSEDRQLIANWPERERSRLEGMKHGYLDELVGCWKRSGPGSKFKDELEDVIGDYDIRVLEGLTGFRYR